MDIGAEGWAIAAKDTQDPFVMIDKKYLLSDLLSDHHEIAVYAIIKCFNPCFVAQPTIAKHTGMSLRKVRDVLISLESKLLISRQKRSGSSDLINFNNLTPAPHAAVNSPPRHHMPEGPAPHAAVPRHQVPPNKNKINKNKINKNKAEQTPLDGLGLKIQEYLIPVKAELQQCWKDTYTLEFINAEIHKAMTWEIANPKKKKTERGRGAFLNNWLNRAKTSKPKSDNSPPKKDWGELINRVMQALTNTREFWNQEWSEEDKGLLDRMMQGRTPRDLGMMNSQFLKTFLWNGLKSNNSG